MKAIPLLFLLIGLDSRAAATAPPAQRSLSEVVARMRQGLTNDNEDWKVLRQDEDRSIPALLDLLERPGLCPRGFATFAIGGFQDYHLQNHISPKNLKLIARRASGFLLSDDRELRDQGLGLLYSYPDPSAIAPLKKFIRSPAPGFQRAQAERTLVQQLSSPAALETQRAYFAALRADPDYAVSTAARRVLAVNYKDSVEVRAQAKAANTEYGSIEASAKALGTGNDWMMGKAAEELMRDGLPALPALIALGTTHENAEVRNQAIGAVRQLVQEPENRTRDAVAPLSECLRIGTRNAGWCADDLGMIDIPEAHDALVACALAPGETRYSCLEAIRGPWSKSAAPQMKTLLNDKDDRVRATAAYILAQNFDDSGLAVLRGAVDAIASKATAGDSPEGRAISFSAAHVVDAFAYVGGESDLERLRTLKVPSSLYQRDIDRRLQSVAYGVELRTKHGDRKGQIEYLKRQFESTGEYRPLYWLSLLMGDREEAEYLLPFARKAVGAAADKTGSQAIQWLTGSGWVDMTDLMRGNRKLVLRDAPIRPR